MDEFARLRHTYYLDHGSLNGSYSELFTALCGEAPQAAGAHADLLTVPVKLPPATADAYVHSGGLHLFQTMFYGDPMQSGFGSGGGLGTLIRELGNAISAVPGVTRVLSLVGRDLSLHQRPAVQREAPAPGHEILRLEYHGSGGNSAFHVDVPQIRTLVQQALQQEALHEAHAVPRVVHTRYIDGASWAAAAAARTAGCALVCTITPDPHRGLCRPDGSLRRLSVPDAATTVYRIRIGDELLASADAVAGIGRRSIEQQIFPYYPQIEDTQGRRIIGIDEGVQILEPENPSPCPYSLLEEGVTRITGGLEESRRSLPIMLCVGRLHPAKGQTTLLQAWITSQLYRQYNLVMIGGDPEQPSSVELEITHMLAKLYQEAPADARKGFLHIGALSNPAVRRLESALASECGIGTRHVYVCSSPKEEFGLSILEAMAAGMPVCAPMQGGAPSYIVHGHNGFLIDTTHAESLSAELKALLDAGSPALAMPCEIGAAARETVTSRYSIQEPAAEFVELYHAAVRRRVHQQKDTPI